MNAEDYAQYRRSKAWRKRRRRCLEDHGHRCQVCGCTSWRRIVDVHHLHYRNVGNERPEDLVPLCALHHELIHEQPDGYGMAVVRRLRDECSETFWDDPLPARVRDYGLRFAFPPVDGEEFICCPSCSYAQQNNPEYALCAACDQPLRPAEAPERASIYDTNCNWTPLSDVLQSLRDRISREETGQSLDVA